jgi:hypothetical protein
MRRGNVGNAVLGNMTVVKIESQRDPARHGLVALTSLGLLSLHKCNPFGDKASIQDLGKCAKGWEDGRSLPLVAA